jgi:hypothetical protein
MCPEGVVVVISMQQDGKKELGHIIQFVAKIPFPPAMEQASDYL